tara:strand:- start:2243 stop:2725 length:483 start_codon:yes stop_codon:yes gene_type:complete
LPTDLITWGAMGVFALFIFFKIKKSFFKKKRKKDYDEPKINSKEYWKNALNEIKKPEKRKEIIKTVIRNIPQPMPEKEPNYEKEEKKIEKNDSFYEIAQDNDDIARNMFGTYNYENEKNDSNYQDMWEDILDQNTDFANEMFGCGKKSKKKKRKKNDKDY